MVNRPDLLFGKLAVKAGYLTEAQLDDLLRRQAEASRAGVPMSFGELCQMTRLLTSQQVQRVLLAQEFHDLREEDRRLGQLAVKNGFTNEEEVALALDEQKRLYQEEHRLPKRLGAILVEMGTLSEQQLGALLKTQARLGKQTSTRTIAAPTTVAPAEAAEKPLPATTASGEEVTGSLIQEAGEGTGRTFLLGKKALLGRQPTNEVPIADQGSSRQHARIEFIGLARQHVLSDLNSKHGTLVNGKLVTEPLALNPGDRIQIAGTVLRYEPGSPVQAGFIPPGATMAGPVQMGPQRRIDTAVHPSVKAPISQSPSTRKTTRAPGVGDRVPRKGTPGAPPVVARLADAEAQQPDDSTDSEEIPADAIQVLDDEATPAATLPGDARGASTCMTCGQPTTSGGAFCSACVEREQRARSASPPALDAGGTQSGSVPARSRRASTGAVHKMRGVQDELEVFEDRLTIQPKGVLGFLNKGLKGKKTIPFSSITAIQHKEAGAVFSGYLQFTVPGGVENRGGLFAATKDENTFMFAGTDKNVLVVEIKEYIEQRMRELRRPETSTAGSSLGDELQKLGEMKAKGLLSEEEFQAAKRRLLG